MLDGCPFRFLPAKNRALLSGLPSGTNRRLQALRPAELCVTTNAKRRFDMAIKWKDATGFDAAELAKMPRIPRHIINAGSLDISKRAVGRSFAKVFGYQLEVNPLEFCGEVVEKSDQNASHDGRLLVGPLRTEEIRSACVYQRAVDNSVGRDGLVLDYRLPIIGGDFPLVYLKYRSIEARFGNLNSYAKLRAVEGVFSPSELKK